MTLEIDIKLTQGDFELDVAFQAPGRGATGIFGPSGCGKTSLLRALAGLEPLRGGRIVIQGEVWHDGHRRRPTIERRIGYVFQEPSLFSHLSVRQNLLFGYRRLAPGERCIEQEEVIELLGLDALLGRPVNRLSGGEAQRVAIGRALLASPRLLLLDEPLAALDQDRKAEILPFLERLHDTLSIPMLYVSHSIDEVVRLADHLLLMRDGRLTAEGPLMTVLASDEGQEVMRREPFAVLSGKVVAPCTEHKLTEVEVSGHVIRLPRVPVRSGQVIRLRLLARDISLSLEPPRQSSILNCLSVIVAAIGPISEDGQQLIQLRLEDTPLVAKISALSCQLLRLKPGQPIIAQVKAASVVR